jgi:hypothetical protein
MQPESIEQDSTSVASSYDISIPDELVEDAPKSILSRKSSMRSLHTVDDHHLEVNVGTNEVSWKDVLQAIEHMQKQSFGKQQKLTVFYLSIAMLVLGAVSGFTSAVMNFTCSSA